MVRCLALLCILLSVTSVRAEGGVPEHTARPALSGFVPVGNGCQTPGLCAAIKRLGLYTSLQLNAAATPTEGSPEVALGGRLGIGLDIARHVAIEASFPMDLVYQGAAQTLLFAGPLHLGTRVVIGSPSATLFAESAERLLPRAALILGADAQLRLSHIEGDPRATSVAQTGVLQLQLRAAVELNWGLLQLTPEVAGRFDASAVDLQVAARLSLRLSSVVSADLTARSQILLYEKQSSQTCSSSNTQVGFGVRGVLAKGVLGAAHFNSSSGCFATHQVSLGITFAFGEEPLRRIPKGEELGIERWWLGMVDPVLDCNGWMLSDDTLLPLFKFGEPDAQDPTVIRRGDQKFHVGDHFDIDRAGLVYLPNRLVGLAHDTAFKEAPAREKAALPECSFGPQHRYQKQCAMRQKVIDDLVRQGMADSTAGLAGSATMQLQLDRDCLSRAEAEDPRQLAADIIGMLGALRGVRPSAGQPNQPKPSQVPRRTFLQENEAKGGHILERHVGKTDEELLERLKREPHLSAASTFTDEEMAEKVIKAAIAENQDLITKWLRSSTGDRIFRVTYDSPTSIGRTATQLTNSINNAQRVRLVLKKSTNGYFILTSYID